MRLLLVIQLAIQYVNCDIHSLNVEVHRSNVFIHYYHRIGAPTHKNNLSRDDTT